MMDARRWRSPAAAAAASEAAEEDAGGGGVGPSRRPPRRGVHRASPYGLGPRRWLPPLPASSRISPGVSRDSAAADNNRMDQGEPMDITHEARMVTHESKSTEPNTRAIANVTPALVDKVNLLPEANHIHQNDGSVFSEIEKIIKQKHFSRDESDRLIEIIRSRTPDLCDEDQRAPKSFAKYSEAATPFSNKLVTPAKRDAQNWGIDVFAPPIAHDVGSSPIELARAYMEAQTSATVHESQRRKFRALSHGVEIDNSASKLFPKAAGDSPVRWPGSVVQEHTNYLTPQSNKGRTLLPASSRSPYSGSVFRRSVKRTGRPDTYSNSSGRPQLSTPFSVGSKAILEDKMTSTDGVLGVQPSTSSERAFADTVGTNTPFFPRDGTAATKNPTFSLERPHGKGTIESASAIGHIPVVDNISKRAALSVHPKSSQTAQKILQHLERTIPSPTAKPLELRRNAKRTTPVAISSPYKVPDSIISNGPRQSSINERGSAYLGISDANKVQEPPSSSNHEESAPKMQSHVASSQVAEMTSSQPPSKTNSATAPAAMVFDKSTSNGFMFSFPVTKTSVSLPEPPPTPSFFSPPKRSLTAEIEEIPKFTFGSSSSTDTLVFSVDSASGSGGADEMIPTFKLGSDKKSALSFDVAGKDAVCF